jgi:Zn-finger nucleic acid-binding protein
MMKCPVDGTILQTVEVYGVELDKCHKCDGIWCDRGEIEQLVSSGDASVEEKIEAQYGDPEIVEAEVDGRMRCPRCDNARLLRFQYTYFNPVILDRCDQCFGVWLDDGELNAVTGEVEAIEEENPEENFKGFFRVMNGLFRRKESGQ